MSRTLYYLVLLVICGWVLLHPNDVRRMVTHMEVAAGLEHAPIVIHPPVPVAGAPAHHEPVQTDLRPGDVASWTVDNFTITPLARYSIEARLLHREPYWFDSAAGVSPEDFALGWEQMADPAVYGKLNISQGHRWYWYWYRDAPPISDDEITSESANTHIIPATPAIEDVLAGFSAGDMVQLSGFLVHVDRSDGWSWTSSLSRTDTGDGACEVMWVDRAAKLSR